MLGWVLPFKFKRADKKQTVDELTPLSHSPSSPGKGYFNPGAFATKARIGQPRFMYLAPSISEAACMEVDLGAY